MSLRKKIICGILLSFIVLIAGAGFLLRDNIRVIFDGLRYSAEELEDQLAQNDQVIQDAAQIVPDITIRDLTEEDKQALKDGTVTKEELVQSMVEPVTKPVPPVVEDTSQPPEQEPAPPTQPKPDSETSSEAVQVSDYQKQLASIIAEVYVLREEFLIKLDNLMEEAKAEYRSIPAGERKAKLSTLAGKYFSKAYGLESECDARMGAIIARMETLLKENDGDLSIAQAVYDTYLNEKSLKKSWYLAELKKRGF